MNKELLELLLKLGFGVVIIMAVIALCALLTPKIAKLYEKITLPQIPVPKGWTIKSFPTTTNHPKSKGRTILRKRITI